MRKTLLVSAAVLPLLAAACGGSPVRSYSAPAPQGALECSLRTMAGLGYTPTAGGVSDGYIRFARTMQRGLLGRDTHTDAITVTSAMNQLRITVVGMNEKNEQTKATDEATGHAQAIISGCSNPSSATGG